MTAAAIYARISQDATGEHLGVDRQERLCRVLAAERGLTISDVLVDNDISAYRRKKRPAFERLVEMLNRGEVSTVITYHADRLYRRTTDLERLVDIVESHGAQVHTVAAGNIDLTTASGRMVARMLGAAAQGESERMGERVRMKGDELAAKGSAPGGRAPYGYSWSTEVDLETGSTRRTYVINPTEAEAVRTMVRRILEGASLLALSRELDAAGVTTREGRAWHHSAVRRVLLNPALVALRVHRREIAGPGSWEPILDRATWEQVRAVIADPARKRSRPARHNLLAGLVENTAGERMNGRDDRAPDGTMTRRTYATRWPASPALSIGADELEAVVVEAIMQRLDDAVLPALEATSEAGNKVAEIEAELVALAELRGEGSITLAEWTAARTPLLRRLEAARAAAAVTSRPSSAAAMLRTPGAVRKAWPKMTFAQKRDVIVSMVKRIVIQPAARGRWTPIDERVDVVWNA